MKRLIQFLLGICAVAPASAGRVDDAISSCLANANTLITQNEVLWRSSKAWATYAKMLCDKVVTSKSQAQDQGIDLSITPLSEAGVPIPLEFKFSNKQSEVSTYDRLYCQHTDVKTATSDMSVVIRGANSADVATAMSTCVVNELAVRDDFWCDVTSASSGKGSAMVFTGDIHFRPKTTMAQPTISNAVILDGARSVPVSQGRKPLKGKKILVGSNTFAAVLDKPGPSPQLQVQLSNGMACTVPIVQDSFVGKIWIDGWSLADAPDSAFNISDSKDCGDSPERRSQRVCIDPFEVPNLAKPVSAWLTSSNCPNGASNIVRVARDAQDAKCVIAEYDLRGCGYKEYPFGVKDCKGSGWIGIGVGVPRLTNSGTKAAGPKETYVDSQIPGPRWSKSFDFMLTYPNQVVLDPKVSWSVEIDYGHKDTPQRGKATLTSASPRYEDRPAKRCFRAEGGTNIERTGVIVYADTCDGFAREGGLSAAERAVLDGYLDSCKQKRGNGPPRGANPGQPCSP